jgi:hypothetical protein
MLLVPFCDFDESAPPATSTMAADRTTCDQSASIPLDQELGAMPKVFTIPELVANILFFLEPAQIMTTQRVSSIFHDVVKTDIKVREAAFLSPSGSKPVLQISTLNGAVDGLTAYDETPAHWTGLPLETFGQRRMYGISSAQSHQTLRARIHLINPSILRLCAIQADIHPSDCRMCAIFNNMPLLAQLQMARIDLDYIDLDKMVEQGDGCLNMQIAQPPACEATVVFARLGTDDVGQAQGMHIRRNAGVRLIDLLEAARQGRASGFGSEIVPRFLTLPGGYFASPEVQNAVLAAGSRGMSCSIKMQDMVTDEYHSLQMQLEEMFWDMNVDRLEFSLSMSEAWQAGEDAVAEGRDVSFDPVAEWEVLKKMLEEGDVLHEKTKKDLQKEQDDHVDSLQRMVDEEVKRMLKGFLPEHKEDEEDEEDEDDSDEEEVMEFQQEGDLIALPGPRRVTMSWTSLGFLN